MSRRYGNSFFACAKRETAEEFGPLHATEPKLETYPPLRARVRFSLVGFNWVTYIVELPEKFADFPSVRARDYADEFQSHGWFPLNALPLRLHHLLWPAILRLKVSGVMHRALLEQKSEK